MKPDIKAKWVTALRSGEYKQGRQVLRTLDDEFCCLGVLCDLHARHAGDNCWNQNPQRWQYADGSCLPPEFVAEWAGLEHKNPTLSDNSASNHNDGGKSFPEIADLIEKHL